ncbi:MAG: TraR/DksA C4-type zinc finger protein [Thermomicrobiaceae bacterium]
MTTREQELSQFEQMLREQLEEAEQELTQLDDQVREFGESSELAEGADNHPGDDSDRLTEQERLLTIRGQLADRKTDIERALEKVDAGEFGACECCGQPIPSGRLEALPFARYCVECQEIMDRDGAATS